MSSDHAVSFAGDKNPDHRRFIDALVAGREEAWTDFHQRYAHRLRAYLRALWKGPDHHLDDLLQLTLLRAVKHISKTKKLPSEEALWSWLTVLARSAVNDYGRKTSRFFRFLQRFQAEPITEATLQSNLEPILQKLDTDSRHLLKLKYDDERSIREIALQLNLSEKAVESRLTRARQKLRKLLKP